MLICVIRLSIAGALIEALVLLVLGGLYLSHGTGLHPGIAWPVAVGSLYAFSWLIGWENEVWVREHHGFNADDSDSVEDSIVRQC